MRRPAIEALRHWGEHEHPVAPDIAAELEAAGFVRVLHLKCEPDPVRMLTTAGFERRDELRAERALTP